MNKKNKFGMRIIFIISIIISLSILLIPKPSLALGVTPAGQLLEYTPNKIVNFSFTIKNSESETKQITVVPVDDENKIISLDIRNFTILAGATQLVFGTITIPKINEPGQKIYGIKIEESSQNNANSNVVAKPTITYILKINVPYPNKYIDFAVLVTPTNNFNSETIQTSVINRGTLPINEVYAKYDVFELNGALKKSIESNKISLESGTAKKLQATLENIASGEYLLKTTMFYDSYKMEKSSQLEFGKKSINVSEIKISKTSTKGIYQLDITRNLNWNTKIDVKTNVVLIDSENKTISQTNIPDETLNPGLNNKQSEFWNISNVPDGKYTILITTESINFKQIYKFNTTISSGQFNFNLPNQKTNNVAWIYYLLGIIIIGIVVYVGLLSFKRKTD